ncbi:hypothetical protein R7D96_11145 [Vibrio sp. Vb2853]|uniref:hypothetical protein n=1 Tax=Vibrio TaxID=662 RepID=UPI001EFD7901|nr:MULTISPECIES: hypothetical protein [Vibrio]MCG9741669.1 hypothetical protein [Vibrio alginolyticus]MDW1614679.1 hypothetical protein [Vibrio sp. Vb2881]MDW1619504.1 hypothetical protein [Vibrio sp. Vb2864]MDW1691530.1 hypothetical protein [Vibrio sp. Vb2853]MDW1710348.1 hypothetical protein [Vibrio sp. Vb2865]
MINYLNILVVACLISFSVNAIESKSSISNQIGVEKSVIDSAESSFELNVEQLCNADVETCDILKNHCNQHPYPNICMIKAVYHSVIRDEFCASDESCVAKQSKYEVKYVNFVKKYAQQAGYGRLAVNVCAPLYEFESSNSNLRNIGGTLNKIRGIGIYYDYESLFDCISETYKQAALKDLQ